MLLTVHCFVNSSHILIFPRANNIIDHALNYFLFRTELGEGGLMCSEAFNSSLHMTIQGGRKQIDMKVTKFIVIHLDY